MLSVADVLITLVAASFSGLAWRSLELQRRERSRLESSDRLSEALDLLGGHGGNYHPRVLATERRKFDRIQRNIDDVLAIDKKSIDALLLRGALLVAQRRIHSALEVSSRLVMMAPHSALALNQRGYLLRFASEYPRSLEMFSEATTIDPMYSVAWYNAGTTYALIGEHDKALGAYAKAIDCDPFYADAWSAKGESLQSLGRLEESVKAHTTATHCEPTWARAFYRLGNAQEELDRTQDAISSYRKSLELFPNYLDARRRLVVLYAMAGESELVKAEAQAISKLKELPNPLLDPDHSFESFV